MPELITPGRYQGLLALFAFTFLAWLLSENRRQLPPVRRFLAVFGFQFAMAFVFLRIPAARDSLTGLNAVVLALRNATEEATSFLFGYAGRSSSLPFPGAENGGGEFFIFAFQALPLIVFVSALAAVLWYWGILKIIIRAFAFGLTALLGTGGAVSLSAAANVLMGQTEAPLLIRPLLPSLSRSELFAVITCGYATVAGTVMALYAIILEPVGPAMLGHIIVASIIAVPAALLYSELLVPPGRDEQPTRVDEAEAGLAYRGTMDAFTRGASEGGRLWANIVVALLAFLALAALINILLANLPEVAGTPLTLERILGFVFFPLVWLIGIPFGEAAEAAQLMGIKTALNEVLAYAALAGMEDGTLSDRSTLMMVYALCGFANVGSLGIVIGAFASLEPGRRDDILALTPKALVTGTFATMTSGAIVGLVY